MQAEAAECKIVLPSRQAASRPRSPHSITRQAPATYQGRVGLSFANLQDVRTWLQTECGQYSEECRRLAYYETLRIHNDGKWEEAIKLLEPYVTQTIALPEVSWSHERCVMMYITTLIDSSRESEARTCLQDSRAAYKKAGL